MHTKVISQNKKKKGVKRSEYESASESLLMGPRPNAPPGAMQLEEKSRGVCLVRPKFFAVVRTGSLSC